MTKMSSLEMLANHIRNMEVSHEKMVDTIVENGRTMVEAQDLNTEAVRDLRGEINSLWRHLGELRKEMRQNASKKQDIVVIKSSEKADPASSYRSPMYKLLGLQEVLAQHAVGDGDVPRFELIFPQPKTIQVTTGEETAEDNLKGAPKTPNSGEKVQVSTSAFTHA
jgi:hypothetical protein